MNWHDAALGMAGVIGSGVAVVHGFLIQRLMVRPIEELLAEKRIAASIRRLVPRLLHFSTFSWFLGGLALVAAAIWFEHTQGSRPVYSLAASTCWARSATFGRRAVVILAGCSWQRRSF